MPIYDSVLDLIGNTPMVDASALSPNPRVRITAKLEGQNPGGSIKDRAGKYMIEEAEKDGSLKPGQVILESSSGNTGIALAMIARMRGYRFKVVLPENVSIERRQLLEVWGAEIIDSPGSEGSNGAMERAKVLAADHPDWWFPFQYGNPANVKAHYEGTGPEIWRDCPEVTHFIAGLGTAGTLMGVGQFLKDQNRAVKVIAIEPPVGEMVDGLKNIDAGFVPPNFVDNDGEHLLDGRMIVRPRESIEWTRRLTEVGIFAGIASGAVMAGAVKLIGEGRVPDGGVVVTVMSDGGWKYLSTGAWTGPIDEVVARAERIIYF
ncbi:MAG: PLP-dependent cysteine synthase family protein [Acidobacteria bacterium]|nr:PLP-dependent cysteine synthase family protein [Acidobacteriota bacterium]